jgi:hypothetical protein
VAISPDEAEAKAAEAAQQIAEHEEFLAGFADAYDEAVRAEVRGARAGKASKLLERRNVIESDLPRLRSSLLAFQEITAEHQAEVAEARRAALREQGDELDSEEREALRETVAKCRDFDTAARRVLEIQERRQSFKRAYPEMAGFADSALNAHAPLPRTAAQMFGLVHRAVFDPGSVGDRSHLQGWADYT